MPIRPENRSRYPADWPQISAAIRDAAGHRCQRCGVQDRSWIRRAVTDDGRAVWQPANWSAHCDSFCADTGAEIPGTNADILDLKPAVQVILTVAHLDHQPENCDPENLRAWCQRCHNLYDAPMRRAGIAARAHAARAAGDLFQGVAE